MEQGPTLAGSRVCPPPESAPQDDGLRYDRIMHSEVSKMCFLIYYSTVSEFGFKMYTIIQNTRDTLTCLRKLKIALTRAIRKYAFWRRKKPNMSVIRKVLTAYDALMMFTVFFYIIHMLILYIRALVPIANIHVLARKNLTFLQVQ